MGGGLGGNVTEKPKGMRTWEKQTPDYGELKSFGREGGSL